MYKFGSFFLFLIINLTTVVLGIPIIQDSESDGLGEFDAEPDLWIPYAARSNGFWSPHPSDFNPMRRLESRTRSFNWNTKREKPYHPVPRIVNQNQLTAANLEENEAAVESALEKRQSPGSYLLMKLGRNTNRGNGGNNNRGNQGRK